MVPEWCTQQMTPLPLHSSGAGQKLHHRWFSFGAPKLSKKKKKKEAEQKEKAGNVIAYLFVINYAWEGIGHSKPSLIRAGFELHDEG